MNLWNVEGALQSPCHATDEGPIGGSKRGLPYVIWFDANQLVGIGDVAFRAVFGFCDGVSDRVLIRHRCEALMGIHVLFSKVKYHPEFMLVL